MGRGRIVFVPRVEEFEELPTDLVLYAPTSGTPQKIVAFYQHALGGEPWPWKMGDWTNLGEALRSAGEWGRQRLVIKHHRLSSTPYACRPPRASSARHLPLPRTTPDLVRGAPASSRDRSAVGRVLCRRLSPL